MEPSNRRQVSLPAHAANPMAPQGRTPMGTHGGSLQGPAQGQGTPGSGLQRQQPLSSSQRAPLNRMDTPAIGGPPQQRKENRVLPIGGPVHISHRPAAGVDPYQQQQQQQRQPSSQQQQQQSNSHQAPNRASLLRRQAEIDEEVGLGHGHGSGAFPGEDMPQQFYTHDHSNPVQGQGQAQPRRHSKGQTAGAQHPQHRHSGGHEALVQRDSGGSHHGSGAGHGQHGHGQGQHGPSSTTTRNAPHIFVHQDSTSTSGGRGASKKLKERERQHMEDEMLKRAREKQIENIKREIRKEKRIMLTFSAISFFLGFFWFIAVCISYWYYVYADEETLAAVAKAYSTQMPPPVVRSGVGHGYGGFGVGDLIKGAVNASTTKGPPPPKPTKPAFNIDINDLFVSSHVGLWRVCRTKRYLQTGNEKILCYWHDMFPSDEKLRTVQYTDSYIVDYQRTEASFAIMSLLVMAMAVPAALYTLKDAKYIFRRLAAGLYFFSSITIIVVLEVTLAKIEHEATKPYLRPPKSTVHYGFCFYIGWIVFAMNLITGCVYLAYSRKRKGDKALDDDDEAQEIIGR